MRVLEYIESLYQDVLTSGDTLSFEDVLPENVLKDIDTIVDSSESSKGVLAVTFTSLVYKRLHPEQDIRRHQISIENGYSGRTFDSHYITPFLRSKSFPSMAESGWLTRSLEQKKPYDLDYPGAIQPSLLKTAFLDLLHTVSTCNVDIEMSVKYLLYKLIRFRDSKVIEIAKPKNLSIASIIDVLIRHFQYQYHSRGASRLPVLAFYAIYQILVNEVKRFEGKTLLPLENHNSADSQSGRLGDIDIVDLNGCPFEAVEVKFDIPVNHDIVERAKEKILPSSVTRYYILSTSTIKDGEEKDIQSIISQVKNAHGCQIVVNGIVPTLKYYLRLLETPALFVEHYAELLAVDDTIKFEHKEAWNKIIAELH